MFLSTPPPPSRLIATRRSAAQSVSLFSSALHASAFGKGSVGGSTQFSGRRAPPPGAAAALRLAAHPRRSTSSRPAATSSEVRMALDPGRTRSR